MSIESNVMARLHTKLYSAIMKEERITVEDLCQVTGSTAEQMQDWLAERICAGAYYVSWRNILQYVGHTNEQGEWVPHPDNWFWAAIYGKPYYRYQDNLANHAQYVQIQNAEYATWRTKNESAVNPPK